MPQMSIRAKVQQRAGQFTSKLGRREAGGAIIGSVTESCEETEFCIRAARLHPGGCGYIVREHEFSMVGRDNHDMTIFCSPTLDERSG
jgi:hypothetical protein